MIVNPIVPPASTVAASAVFVSVTLGHCTVVEALLVSVGLLVAVSVTVFE